MKNIALIIGGIGAYLISVILGYQDFDGWITLLLWVISLMLLFWSAFKPEINLQNIKEIKFFSCPLERYLFLVVLFTGVFFRFYKLDVLPFGLWLDELEFATRAIDLLKHNYSVGLFKTTPLYWEYWVVIPNLYLYYALGIFKILGINYWAIKMASVLPSIGIIIGSYYLFKTISDNYITPLITTFLISVSHWSVTIDRWGWNEVLMCMLQVFSYYFIIRGLKNKNYKYLSIGGIILGLSFYTYVGANIVIAIIVIFLSVYIFSNMASFKTSLKQALVVIISAVIIILPGTFDYINKPSSYFVRMKQISVFNHIKAQKSFKPLLVALERHIKMFHIQGDRENRHNTHKMPQLDVISGIYFVIGLCICLWNVQKPYNILLFIWLLLGMSGGIFSTYEDAPHAYRTALVIPVVMYFAATGLKCQFDIINKYSTKTISILILSALMIITLVINYKIYFVIRPNSYDCYKASLNPNDLIIARKIKQLRDNFPQNDIYMFNELAGKSFTCRIINYVDPKSLPDSNNINPRAYILPYTILNDNQVDLFALPEKNLYLIYAPKYNYIVRKLYNNPIITSIKDPFGNTIALLADITADSIIKSKGFIIKKTYPKDKKSILYGSIAFLKVTTCTFKRLKPNVELIIDGQKIFNNNSNTSQDIIIPMGPALLQLQGPYMPDELEKSIMIKQDQEQSFVLLFIKLPVYKYTELLGLFAYYFNNPRWEDIPFSIEVVNSFSIQKVGLENNFSIKWEGYLNVETPGEYYFKIGSDDESFLYIDNKLIINNGSQHSFIYKDNTVKLAKGPHKLVVKYNQFLGGKSFEMLWRPPWEQSEQPVSFDHLTFYKPH